MMSDTIDSSSDNVAPVATAASPDDVDRRERYTYDIKPKRDFWDYVEILARPIAGSLTALAIAWIGFMGNATLKEQQRHESEIARKAEEAENRRAADAQDHRLFTDLVSKREDAETALRKDMFNTILGDFFDKSESQKDQQAIPTRLLKLEMLALNFGESLSLTPLFIQLDQHIHEARGGDGNFSELDWIDQRDRLHSLARTVSGRQISALAPGGKIFEFDVNVQQATNHNTFRWPHDSVTPSAEVISALSDISLDGIKRTYSAEFSSADQTRKTVAVHIEIQTWDPVTDEPLPDAIDMDFELNFFNFPMVDNTRLSGDQRFALVMERFDELNIHVVGIIFRGMYSSNRDKPFIDDVINQLKRKTPVDRKNVGATSSNSTPKESDDAEQK
jgi:hypothetical protein